MHTDSSASITYFASASASEWTATVLMPISRQARWMRSAISPRFAIRIFSNIRRARLFDDEERLAVLDRLAVLHEDRLDRPGGVGLDLVQQLHGLDDAKRLALGHGLADLDERRGSGRRGSIERPHHGRFELVALGFGGSGGGCGFYGSCGGRRVPHGLHRLGCQDHGRTGRLAADADLLLAFGDLDLPDPGLLDEVDQLLQLAQVHAQGLLLSTRVNEVGSVMMPAVSPLFATWIGAKGQTAAPGGFEFEPWIVGMTDEFAGTGRKMSSFGRTCGKRGQTRMRPPRKGA